MRLSQTLIASEIPGIADMSPPTTLKVKSNFFCKPKVECCLLNRTHMSPCVCVCEKERGGGVGAVAQNPSIKF